jgi:thiamine biosynthesis protein ThiI
LKEYQGRTKLYIAYIGEEQLKMKNKVEPRFLVVLYRRLFYRVAEKVAKKENAKAIVTGESLGQVSSQTLQNLMVEEEAIKIPVLRPLIGMDKEEIVEIAKKLKTYEISIRPCEDTCSLFVPKHSSAYADLKKIKEMEKRVNMKKIVSNVLKKLEVKEI